MLLKQSNQNRTPYAHGQNCMPLPWFQIKIGRFNAARHIPCTLLLARMNNPDYHKTTIPIQTLDAFTEYMDDRNIACRHFSTNTPKIWIKLANKDMKEQYTYDTKMAARWKSYLPPLKCSCGSNCCPLCCGWCAYKEWPKDRLAEMNCVKALTTVKRLDAFCVTYLHPQTENEKEFTDLASTTKKLEAFGIVQV